nr:leucine-rich repeat domain-containing protein [Leptospira weilii]
MQLKKLRHLHLSSNQLTNLPKEIGELKNLQELDLSANELTTLPKEIAQLKKLKQLHLHKNPITREEIERIQKLLPKCTIYFE